MTAAVPEAPTFPAADLDRRFYAFTIDRLIAWTVDGAVALAAYHFLISDGRALAGIALVAATVLLVGLAFSALQGLKGYTPGKVLLDLRVVHHGSGTPIGLVPAMIRSLILGFSALPTFGLGAATLAWTAVMDRDRQRRGWHDHMTESTVVDVRPVPVPAAEVARGPRQIVNLTALRLVPAPQPAPGPTPATPPTPPTPPSRGTRPGPTAAPAAAPAPTPTPTPAPAATPTPTPTTVSVPRSAPLRAPLGPGDGASTTEPTVVRADAAPDPARWRVTFDTGESLLVEGLALVGRRPEPRDGEPVRHLVAMPSQDMSLSKTHAQLQVAPDGALVVMDRGSTNGTVVVRQAASRALTAGTPTTLLDGDLVRFGDRTMTVTRES